MLGAIAAKFKEAVSSVAPIALIVLALAFTIAPLDGPTVLLFALSAVVLVVGMTLFTLGSEIAMTPMGEMVGARLSEKRSLAFLIIAGFCMGAVITIAEPDLAVLAAQVPAFPNAALIFSVAAGVGAFLVLGLLRTVFRKRLNLMLLILYAIVFLLAIFADNSFLPVAFDSGGVTTGPITVPFILALGVGVAAVRSGQSSEEDSFGLVALCSIGPILAVLVLAMFFDPASSQYAAGTPALLTEWGDVLPTLSHALPHYLCEVSVALLPILLVFAIFQAFWLKLPVRRLLRMVSGIVYTLAGLCLFLAAVNTGFLPVGYALGGQLAALPANWVLVPLAMLMAFSSCAQNRRCMCSMSRSHRSPMASSARGRCCTRFPWVWLLRWGWPWCGCSRGFPSGISCCPATRWHWACRFLSPKCSRPLPLTRAVSPRGR